MYKLIAIFGFLIANTISNAQTYGNWSGTLYTSSQTAENVDWTAYSQELHNFIQATYAGSYVKVIGYVTQIGEKYTISIEYPQNGTEYGIFFTGGNPYLSNGFWTSSQNNVTNCNWVRRWNITNSSTSTCNKTYVITVTSTPSKDFRLKIEYPAIDDNIVDSALPNPGCPSNTTPYYWGGINNTILLDCSTTSSIDEVSMQSLALIYPNPASNYTNLFTESEGEYFIYDNSRLLYQGKINNKTTQIPLDFLSDGYYFIQINTAKGIVTKKIVVKH